MEDWYEKAQVWWDGLSFDEQRELLDKRIAQLSNLLEQMEVAISEINWQSVGKCGKQANADTNKAREICFNGIKGPVYRCKECPLVRMGTTSYNWTCDRTNKIVPLNRIHEECPLPEYSVKDK
jgi:hypothetical protein